VSGERWRAPALFALLAIAASLPRFGERENPAAALSDSDYYLDMAGVAAGERPAFDAEWSDPGYFGAHHYGRPLAPFLAGTLARALPVAPAHAFSVLAVLAAWAVAVALHRLLVHTAPGLRIAWLPSALFLTGFPQMNWGYHVLTDTVGYATAFLSAVAAGAAIERDQDRRLPLALLGVFALQALAFLARETAWMVPVAVAWTVLVRWRAGEPLGRGAAVLGAVLLAAVPHQLYLRALGLRGIAIPFTPAAWLDGAYLLDFVVKSALAFHLLWLLALVGWRTRERAPVPAVLVGWTLAALAYMAAGYAHNTLGEGGIGYPLRLTWALFPAVLLLVAWGVEGLARAAPRRVRAAALAVLVLNAGVALAGTLLDRGATGVTVPALMERARSGG
jgi:hypothetical protein